MSPSPLRRPRSGEQRAQSHLSQRTFPVASFSFCVSFTTARQAPLQLPSSSRTWTASATLEHESLEREHLIFCPDPRLTCPGVDSPGLGSSAAVGAGGLGCQGVTLRHCMVLCEWRAPPEASRAQGPGRPPCDPVGAGSATRLGALMRPGRPPRLMGAKVAGAGAGPWRGGLHLLVRGLG